MRKVNKSPRVKKPDLAGRTRLLGKLPVQSMSSYNDLVSAIECLVQDARTGIKAAMNAIMLQTYWRTGEYIVEYEQNGADRAKYGTSLIRCLARDLTLRLGKGFSRSNLQYMRKFYLVSQKIQTSGFFGKGQKLGDRPCDCAGNLHNIRLLFENNATFQNGHFGDRPQISPKGWLCGAKRLGEALAEHLC